MQGDRIGPYVIAKELGSGGMGTVYDATDEDGRRVALKLVHPHLLAKEGYRERFLREVEVGRRIVHPNVVRTLDGGEIDGRPFVALEFVDGQTLEELLRELGRVPEDLCRHIGHEVARGLEAVHARGVVHRDVKPGNVLITPEQVVKVMDLGLARQATGDDRLSMSGMFVGTAGYAPPEQFRGTKDIDPRGDLYSLGALLYELSTGEAPFRADNFQAMVRLVLDEKPRRPGQLAPQLSPFFEELILVLLAKQPEGRVASASLLAEVLARGESTDWWSQQMTVLREETRRPLRRIRIPRETECVGRDEELAALRRAFDAAKAGDGGVVLLEGEAGIGKSRLIDELMRLLEADGEDVNFLYGSYPPGGAATAAGAFSRAYGEHFGNAGCASYLTEAPLLAPAFDALLRGDAVPDGAPTLTSDSLKTVLVHATRALGRTRPTIVVIDDLHFAPDEGRALFASLAMAVPGHPILLVGTARPGLPTQWRGELERLDHVSHQEVHRLGPQDVSLLLEPVIGKSLHAERLAASIAATADGNPFFLFEIVRSLRESGVVSQADDGSWSTESSLSEFELPSTVQNLLDARIERLSDEGRELLECAACWGFEFDGRLVAEALGMRRLPALRLLGRLEQEHGLVRAAGANFVFDHHAVQEHLYERLPEAMREELHRALAEALELRTGAAAQDPKAIEGGICVELCEHYLRGAQGGKAGRYVVAALGHLQGGYLNAHLLALADRALSVPGLLVGEERAVVLGRKATTLGVVGNRAAQREVLEEALALAERDCSVSIRVSLERSMGMFLGQTGDLDAGREFLTRAVDRARDAGETQLLGTALNNLGTTSYFQGRDDEARRTLRESIALARESGNRMGEASANGNLGLVYLNSNQLDEAEAQFRIHQEISRETGFTGGEAISTMNLGIVAQLRGRLDEAREHYTQALALTCSMGHRSDEARHLGHLGELSREQARFAEAIDHSERRLAIAREIRDSRQICDSSLLLGELRLAVGEPESARDALREALTISRAGSPSAAEPRALELLGDAAQRLEESEESRRLHEEAVAVRRRHGCVGAVAEGLTRLGASLASIARTSEAVAALTEARDAPREEGHEHPIAEVLSRCHLAALTGDGASAARASFEEWRDDLELLDRMQAHFALWRASGVSADLAAAHEMLRRIRVHAPEGMRRAVMEDVPLHRAIAAAWDAHDGTRTDG